MSSAVAPAARVGADRGSNPAPAVPSAARRGARSVWTFLLILRANPLSLVGFLMVVVLAGIAAIVAIDPSLLPYAPFPYYTPTRLSPPSLQYPFGTDEINRNMLSLNLAALPVDLSIALGVTAAALLIGGTLGLIAGFWDKPGTAGGWASSFILRVTDIFLAFPSLVLALAVAAILGLGVWQTSLAILFTWWPFYVRLTRGEVLAVKHLPYVTAARAAGVSSLRILMRHVVRNITEPLIVYFTMDIGTVIVTLSTISFIGVGVPATIPEWGNLFKQYTDQFLTAPWTLLSVGFMIFITVLAFSLLGDGLRDVLDPRSRRMLTQTAVVSQTAAQEEPELSPSLPSEAPEGGPEAGAPAVAA